ncbi:MAG: substrate-binding domain-containing protein [Nitrospirae bacterium]|nr:substrate-binding domain-containing protein [Nitrospirota bacterium]
MKNPRSAVFSLFFLIMLCLQLFATQPVAIAGETIRINGSGSGLDMMMPLMDAYLKSKKGITFEIEKPLGSSGAIKALIAGYLDIAVSSKPLKPEETAQGCKMRYYGKTPLTIVTNATNTKKNIATKELEDIYSGLTRKWPNGDTIRPVLRPVEDIDTKILKGFSPGMAEAINKANVQRGMIIAVTDPESNDAVAKTIGSIGASGLTGVLTGKWKLNVLSLNGVMPSTKTLSDGSYPLAKEVNFVVTEKLSEAATKFLNFIYSEKGRAIAEKSGVFVKTDAQ